MLRCVRDYKSGSGKFQAGDIIDRDEDFEAWLLRDCPGAFEVLDVTPPMEVHIVAEEAPEQSKAILSPRKRGGK